MKRRIRSRLWPLALLLAPMLNAEEARLPEPLTLEYALALADEAHPALALQQARVDENLALQELSESEDGWNVGLTGSLRAVHPSHRAIESSSNDSSLRLKMRKRLYDFGHSEATREPPMPRWQAAAGPTWRHASSVAWRSCVTISMCCWQTWSTTATTRR